MQYNKNKMRIKHGIDVFFIMVYNNYNGVIVFHYTIKIKKEGKGHEENFECAS